MKRIIGGVAVIVGVMALAACGGVGLKVEKHVIVVPVNGATPTPNVTTQPTLDIEQIPMLGEEDPAPPVPLAATDERFPIEPATGEVYNSGQQLYEQNCAACHGLAGEGQQPEPLAPGAAPPHNADGHTWHHADQQNFATVWTGRRVAGSMPGYHDRLTPDEIVHILAYIKTWWEPGQLEQQLDRSRRIADQ